MAKRAAVRLATPSVTEQYKETNHKNLSNIYLQVLTSTPKLPHPNSLPFECNFLKLFLKAPHWAVYTICLLLASSNYTKHSNMLLIFKAFLLLYFVLLP